MPSVPHARRRVRSALFLGTTLATAATFSLSAVAAPTATGARDARNYELIPVPPFNAPDVITTIAPDPCATMCRMALTPQWLKSSPRWKR